MKGLSFLVLSIAIASTIADDDGQYRPGKYGDEGKYVPGDEGRYSHIGDGGDGKFQGQGLSGGFQSQGSAGRFGNVFKSAIAPNNNDQFVNRFVVDSASSNISPFSHIPKIFTKPSVPQYNVKTFSAPSHSSSNPEASSRTLKHESELNHDSYHYAFETDNHIRAAEDGRIVNPHTKFEGLKATGFYEYVGPDNVRYRVDYIADENGFQPIGVHLPTPPPIPEEIARILVDVGKK